MSTEAPVDPLAETQPARLTDPFADYQPVPVETFPAVAPPDRKTRSRSGCGCWYVATILLGLVLLSAYLLLPPRTNVVVLGIDDRDPGEALGRTDTIILLTFQPIRRYVGMLSIPRDLWVQIPGRGENRINTAHFFAEAEQPGSGPDAVKAVIQANFGVEAGYFVRARFDNFIQFIDTMGGIEITLSEETSGYPAGSHHLNGEQALAFVRDRSDGDDFSRMQKAQLLLRSLVISALSPLNAPHWPEMARVALSAVETDIPLYLWPRLGAALLWAGAQGLDARIIEREMASPVVTSEGAQVLQPHWELIRPMIREMFGE